MKKYLLVALTAVFLQPVFADEDTFLTLTRRATPISQLPTNISVATQEDIKNIGAQTLADVLDILPSVDVSRSGSLGSSSFVRMRGVPSSNQVQILVDDQPIGGISIQNINVGLIPVENIDRIEVVRGGSSVLYGANTMGGIIHIITKKNASNTTIKAGAERRSFGARITSGEIGARAGQTDGLITLNSYSSDGYQQNTDATADNVAANTGLSFGNGGRIEGAFDHTKQEIGTANGTPVPYDQWNGRREREPNSTTQRVKNQFNKGRFKVSLPILENGFIQSSFFHSVENYELLLSPNTAPLATYDNTVTGNDTRFILPYGLTTGFSYERNRRDSQGQDPHHITNTGLYVEEQLTAGKLTIAPALRFDQHSSFGNQYNPRLTMVLRPNDAWKISANAARSFRAPTLVDLYIVATDPTFPAADFFGNPNLNPEIAWTYDLGTQIAAGDAVVFDVTGFYSRIKNRMIGVDSDSNGFTDTTRNVGLAEMSGVETTVLVKTGPFTQKANHTFQRAVGNSPTSTKFVPLRLTPRHLVNYQLIWKGRHGTSLANTIQYVSRQYETDGNLGVGLPAYGLWHARIEQQIRSASVFFGINNITNKLYSESITFGTMVPQPTRVFMGGVTVRI